MVFDQILGFFSHLLSLGKTPNALFFFTVFSQNHPLFYSDLVLREAFWQFGKVAQKVKKNRALKFPDFLSQIFIPSLFFSIS